MGVRRLRCHWPFANETMTSRNEFVQLWGTVYRVAHLQLVNTTNYNIIYTKCTGGNAFYKRKLATHLVHRFTIKFACHHQVIHLLYGLLFRIGGKGLVRATVRRVVWYTPFVFERLLEMYTVPMRIGVRMTFENNNQSLATDFPALVRIFSQSVNYRCKFVLTLGKGKSIKTTEINVETVGVRVHILFISLRMQFVHYSLP